MNDEAKKAAKKWLLARVDEELTQDQIAKLLQEFLPKGPDQSTVGRIIAQCGKDAGYPTGITLKGITALLERKNSEEERARQQERVATPPSEVQSAPRVATEDVQVVEPVVEAPGPTPEDILAANRRNFLERQAEVDRDIKDAYERLADAGVVEAGHTELHGDALIFHTHAIRFEYVDPGAEIIGLGPSDYVCSCGLSLEVHRKGVTWEERAKEFAYDPGSDRPESIGMRSTGFVGQEPCLDGRWFRGEVLERKLAYWRRLRTLTPSWWKEGTLPISPSRGDIIWFEAVLGIETQLLGPQEMLSLMMPILDWKLFVYNHKTETMSMDDALAHQHARLKSLKRRARANELVGKIFNAAGYLLLLSVAGLVAAGTVFASLEIQDWWWSRAVSSPWAILPVLVVLALLARRPWPGSASS